MPRFDPKTWACALCEAMLVGTAVRRAKIDKKLCDYCEHELARTARKRCRKCGVVQPIAVFCRSRHSPDGHIERCHVCHSQAAREWRQANPERAQVIRARYLAAHAEQERARKRASRKLYPETWKRHNRRAYHANPKRAQARAAAWAQANKERRRSRERERERKRYPERKYRRWIRSQQTGIEQ